MRWLVLGAGLAASAGTACFPEFDRDRLADASICDIPCEQGMICLPDGGCAAPGQDAAATDGPGEAE